MFSTDATHLTPGSLTPVELRMNTTTSFVPSQGVNLQLEDGAARMRARLSTTARDATGLTRPPTSAPSTPPTTPLGHDAKATDASRRSESHVPASALQSQGFSENQRNDPRFPSDRNDPSWWRIISRDLCQIVFAPMQQTEKNNSRVLRRRHHRHRPPQLLRQAPQGTSTPPTSSCGSQLSSKQTLTQALAMQRVQQHQQAVGQELALQNLPADVKW